MSSRPPRYSHPSTADLSARIHPSAQVDRMASLGVGVEIGPFAIVEAGASIGDGTRVLSSAYIATGTEVGAQCEIHMGAILGHTPQIRDFKGPGGGLVIGDRTIVREYATVHRASTPGVKTFVGRDALLLGGCHVAHDGMIGDGVTIANGALLAGFVCVGAHAFISGNVVVHQYVRIGEMAMIGGGLRVSKDVPPFMLVGRDSCVTGMNIVGMRRAGLTTDRRRRVRQAYGILYRSALSVSHALERLRALPPSAETTAIVAFVEASSRGICAASRGRNAGARSHEADARSDE